MAEDDSEIFSLDRVQFQFPAPLVAMSVSNEVLVMALETNHILRIDLQQAHDVEGIWWKLIWFLGMILWYQFVYCYQVSYLLNIHKFIEILAEARWLSPN